MLFHLLWCGLLWLLWTQRDSAPRTVAATAFALGAIPRAVIAAALLPTAWTRDAWGWAALIAFHLLTLLWFVFLASLLFRRTSIATRVALPMLLFAAVELLEPLGNLAGMVTAAALGGLPRGLLKLTIHLAFCLAQILFLRSATADGAPQPTQWSRL